MVLAIDIGSCNAGFPSGGFSCAEALLQSLNLAERLPAKDSEVIPTMLSRSVSSPWHCHSLHEGGADQGTGIPKLDLEHVHPRWYVRHETGARRLKLRSYATI